MSQDIKDLQTTASSYPPISTQDAAIDEIEETMRRLRISPKKVLDSLGHLRIEKARIKPLENNPPKSGGKADVEAAILVPAQSSNSMDPEDTEYVALKKLRFDTSTNSDRVLGPFAHEVNLLNDLSHPGVVKLVGFVEDIEEGIAWMVFSWEKNGNLREFVRSANWELPERVSLIDDVARGLSYLHGRAPPICHGDLKSLNILVSSQNQAIITDFGSARTMDSATAAADGSTGAVAETKFKRLITATASTTESVNVELAASGDFITMTGPAWTIRWAAPELLEGELPGLESDIWALGWICWEAITGNFPFDEENDLTIVLRITRGDLPAVGDNAQLKQIKALCSLMGECWRLNANERPTAIRCQQVISFMYQAIPSNSEGSSLAKPRSSGLLHALGWIQLQNGMMMEAQEYFQDSLEVAKSVGDNAGRANALYALGEVDRIRNDYSKAEESYTQARDTYSQIGHQTGVADSVKGLGHMYQMQSEYSKAEESYIQARDIFSQIENLEGFADSVLGLGDVYHMRNEASKAEEAYIQARDTYSQIGNQLGFAGSVKGLGDVYQMRDEYSTAEGLYIQAHDTYSQVGNQLGFANSFQALGRVYSAQEQYAKAEESYLKAQAVYRQMGDMLSLANNLWYLGWLRRSQAQYGDAERFVCESSALYVTLGLKDDVAECDDFLKDVRQQMAS